MEGERENSKINSIERERGGGGDERATKRETERYAQRERERELENFRERGVGQKEREGKTF